MKTCKTCDTEFTPGSNRALFCSDPCRSEARRRRQRAQKPCPEGNRRDGFPVVVDGVAGRWRPRYLSEDRDRLPTASRDDLRNLRTTFDGSKSGGAVDRYGTPYRRDRARQWALERGVDIGPGF